MMVLLCNNSCYAGRLRGLLQNGTLLGLEHAYLVAQRGAAFLRSPAIHCFVAVVLPQLALLTAPACVCTHRLRDIDRILVFDPQSLHSAALCTSAMPVPAGLRHACAARVTPMGH